MDEKKISVIVAVYNIENLIAECIESIIGQTYQNLEILLVDDGSCDRSGRICDEYARKDQRIKVLHKQNGGLSDARNEGLNCAKGDYIAFVDGDDWLESTMYEQLLTAVCETDSDMAFGVTEGESGKSFHNPKDGSRRVLEEGQILDAFIKGGCVPHIMKAAWDKLYTRQIIGDTRFIKGIHSEDGPFNTEILLKCRKCVFVGRVVYHYRDIRPGSISSLGISDRFFSDKLFYLNRQIGQLRENGREDLARHQICGYYQLLLKTYSELEKEKTPESKGYQRKIRRLAGSEKGRIFQSFRFREANTKYCIKCMLLLYCPPALRALVK